MRVTVGGHLLTLTILDKPLYPDGTTKAEVIDYYTRVGPVILPHLADRQLTRIRYPDGADAQGFFEKNAPAGTPSWVRRDQGLIVVEGMATLVWLAHLAALELHTPQWRVDADPDRVVFDLDPDTARLVRSRVHQHHVGDVDRLLEGRDPAIRIVLGRLLVVLPDVHALHHDPIPVPQDTENRALQLPEVPPDHPDAVALHDPVLTRRTLLDLVLHDPKAPREPRRRSSCSASRGARAPPARRCACPGARPGG